VWNARSLNNKCDDAMIFFQDHDIDIAFISETWMTQQSNNTSATVKYHGYNMIHDFRQSSMGGGTAIIFKAGLSVSTVNFNITTISTFGFTSSIIKCSLDMKILLLCVYRTGPVSRLFFEELHTLMQYVTLRYDYLIVAGDFNIHIECANDSHATEFLQAMQSYGLKQHVDMPTHYHGGTIDLLFDNSNLIDCESLIVYEDVDLSDHYPICCSTQQFSKSSKEQKQIVYREIKKIDTKQLKTDFISVVNTINITGQDLKSSYTTFSEEVTKVLDNHAPLISKTITSVNTAQWFDAEYKEQRKLRRKAEERWLKSKSEEDFQFFRELRNETTNMARLKKQKFYRSKIESKEGDVKAIFNVVNKELDRKQKPPLPDSSDAASLATEFNEFFIEKIKKIRQNLDSQTSSVDVTPASTAQTSDNEEFFFLDEFEPCSIEELRGIIVESGIKCSPSDILPTKILKENIDVFLPSLCELVNLSLETGSMDGLKVADIIPNLKNHKLDPNNFKSYRPISNLTFLGKLVERVVLKRLNAHLTRNNLNTPEQSAYKQYHSTETISIKVINDILVASDKNTATVLVMLDLSAAFDTVHHGILLRILEKDIGIRSNGLKWFKSFLTGRSQRTRIGDITSDTIYLLFGVPQGSVLGPVLFNLYIRSLYSTVTKYGFLIQGYADDQQVYKSFPPCKQVEILTMKIRDCILLIQQWMTDFYLQLNPDKTQIMVLGPQRVLSKISLHGIQLTNDVCIRFTSSSKSLGIHIDESLSFKDHIIKLKRDCFRVIRNICKMRFIFTKEQLKIIVNSLVVCKLDYGNALFYGVDEKLLDELQRTQNAAAKAIFGLYKYDHVGDSLQKLHWLPIRERVVYKNLLLVFKCLNGMGPEYLTEMLSYTNYSHTLHLCEPCVNTSLGERAFQRYAPKLWNGMPASLKECNTLLTFKKHLKTYLFDKAFNT